MIRERKQEGFMNVKMFRGGENDLENFLNEKLKSSKKALTLNEGIFSRDVGNENRVVRWCIMRMERFIEC